MSTFIQVIYRQPTGGLEQRLINVDCVRSISPLDDYTKGCVVRYVDSPQIEVADTLGHLMRMIEACEQAKRVSYNVGTQARAHGEISIMFRED